MLRKIFGTKRVEVTVEQRQLHHKKVHYLHSSDIVWVIKSMKHLKMDYTTWP